MSASLPGQFDLLVVGAGINGAGIARDAAGRGLRVAIVEQDDIAAHTSSCSTKLIHGGLRYLEHFELGLVRKALQEREVLIASAPNIMWPLRFVMPHAPHLRPAWLIRLGLFLYDNLARRRYLPGSRRVNLRRHVAGAALNKSFRTGFIYSDGWVDDSRLVLMNVKDAAERGASVFTYTRCSELQRGARHWRATLSPRVGASTTVTARVIVNATGPWVADFLQLATASQSSSRVRLVQGSHIVVRRMFEHSYAYIFQGADKRIVFAIPYEHDFTLIGTTDVEYVGRPENVRISEAEIDYLCKMANSYFSKSLSRADVIWSYAGVRPLLDDRSDDASTVTRDYRLDFDDKGPPILSVFGGKLTTYRRLAEEAMTVLAPHLAMNRSAWTASARLPGGDMDGGDFSHFSRNLRSRYPWLPTELRKRFARAYGSRSVRLLAAATDISDLGEEVLPGLYACEINYLRSEEWAHTADDILWRRSKLGLHLPVDSAAKLTQWLLENPLNASLAKSANALLHSRA